MCYKVVWFELGKRVYSVSHDQLSEIAGSNMMINSQEVFNKSPNHLESLQLLKEEGLNIYKNYTFKQI